MIKRNFSKRIDLIRVEKGLSQFDVANRSGLSHSYVNRIVSGTRNNISIDKLRLLAESLEVSMIDLLYDSNDEIEMSSLLRRHNLLFNGKTIEEDMRGLIYELLKRGIYSLDDSRLDYDSEFPLRVLVETF